MHKNKLHCKALPLLDQQGLEKRWKELKMQMALDLHVY